MQFHRIQVLGYGKFPSIYWCTPEQPYQYTDKGYSLGLNPIEGQRNLASETIGINKLNIDTSIKYCFKFISDKLPNPNDTFIIKNKKYLCDKLEITFTDNGLDKLMTGYFFAIED